MPSDPPPPEEPVVAEYPGADEVPSVAWPLLLRERVHRRLGRHERYRWFVLWAVLAGLFSVGFTVTVLAVAIPTIAEDLGASETSLTWVVTGPFLAFALGMPLLGKLGDRVGHRRVYLVGIGFFVVVTALTAFAWSAGSLIFLRVLSGFEGAAAGPASLALIMHAFDREDRVKAMGWWSLVGAGAPVIGVAAGGPLVEALGWRAVFAVQTPLAATAWVVGALVLRETPRGARAPLDVAGAAVLAASVVPPLIALNVATSLGWASPFTIALFACGPIGLVAFVRIEQRARDPVIPLGLFRRRNFSAPLIALGSGNFAYMGGFIISPLLIQDVFGYSLSITGLVMLARPLSYSISAPPAGYVAVRVGERAAAITGTASIALSMVVLASGAMAESLLVIGVGLVLSGLGNGIGTPSLTSSVANAAELAHQGVANATQQMFSLLGLVTGIQVLATVQGGAETRGSFAVAYLVGGGVAVFAILAATFVRSIDRRAPLRIAEAA